MEQTKYDVIIAGAGMVGAALACALAKTSKKIAIIEHAEPQMTWPEESVDLRVSAISRSSENFFRHLEAWAGMEAMRVCPYTDMHVWEGVGVGEIHFDSADMGEPSMGYIIENRVIRTALLERMQTFSNIEFICPATINEIHVEPDNVTMSLSNGRLLSGELLVGADGGRSFVRETVGITTVGWPYQQSGVVAVVSTTQSHCSTAWQRFLATGPLALLPLSDGRSSIVWSTTPEEAKVLCELDDENFCQRLGEVSEHKLGEILDTTKRAAFPLRLQHAERYIQHRIALIGDAAHTIHPLAGQGANLGFMDAACLAELLTEAAEQGRDLGSVYHLRKYERWRKGSNLSMMFAMDGFKRLFSNDFPFLAKLRGFGLSLTNRASPIKHELMRRAMGLEGEMPRLAQRRV